MACRHDGLDLAHVKLVLEKLSKFHAASAVFEENNGPYSDALWEGMFNEKLKPMMESFFVNNLHLFKETVGSFVNAKRFLKQMVNLTHFQPKNGITLNILLNQENYVEKSFDKCLEAAKSNPNGFNVLNHGDLWTNNLMFQYDGDKVKNMLFVSKF